VRQLRVLFEDDRLLAVGKPPGLLTVPAPRGSHARGAATLIERLADEGHAVLAVHRLDRETSGVVLLAKDAGARDALMALFRERGVTKTYLAIVQGHPRPAEGLLCFPIRDLGAHAVVDPRGSPAETAYRVVERVGPAALVEVRPRTGRHNQVRLHFAQIGMPLAGERKYALGRDALVRHRRAALHAARLEFRHPWTGAPVAIEDDLPVDLRNLLDRLRRGA
jgi:23S rRNA pseudouridine1911/1915/1917 synthase